MLSFDEVSGIQIFYRIGGNNKKIKPVDRTGKFMTKLFAAKHGEKMDRGGTFSAETSSELSTSSDDEEAEGVMVTPFLSFCCV